MKIKKFIYIIAGFIFISAAIAFAQTTSCQSDNSLAKCKKALGNYNYDLSEVTNIPAATKDWAMEYQLLLFTSEKYKLIFNTEGLNQKITIEVWSKKSTSSGTEKLFTTQGLPENQKEFVFEPKRSNKIFIKYIVPKAEAPAAGCIVMLLGYEFK